MDILESNYTIIRNKPTRNESNLVFVDEFREEGPQSVNQALRNNLIHYIAKTKWPEILQLRGMGNLWDHNYGGVINSIRHDSCVKEFQNRYNYFVLQNNLVTLINLAGNPTVPGAFKGPYDIMHSRPPLLRTGHIIFIHQLRYLQYYAIQNHIRGKGLIFCG